MRPLQNQSEHPQTIAVRVITRKVRLELNVPPTTGRTHYSYGFSKVQNYYGPGEVQQGLPNPGLTSQKNTCLQSSPQHILAVLWFEKGARGDPYTPDERSNLWENGKPN